MKILKNNKGSALVIVMVFILILIILGTAMLGVTINEYKMQKVYANSIKAYYLAEAGLEKAINNISKEEDIIEGLLTWEMDSEGEDSGLLEEGLEGNFIVTASITLDKAIYVDEEETILFKEVFKVSLNSTATVENIEKVVEAKVYIEDYAENFEDFENKVEIKEWQQIK